MEIEQLLETHGFENIEELDKYLSDVLNDNEEYLPDNKDYCKKAMHFERGIPDCRKILEIKKRFYDSETNKLFRDRIYKLLNNEMNNNRPSTSSVLQSINCNECRGRRGVEGSRGQEIKAGKIFFKVVCTLLDPKIRLDIDDLFYENPKETQVINFKKKLITINEINYISPLEKRDMKNRIQKEREEHSRLYEIEGMPRDNLKEELSNQKRYKGSDKYEMNLLLYAFEKGLLKESYGIAVKLMESEEFKDDSLYLNIWVNLLSYRQEDEKAIDILNLLEEKVSPLTDISKDISKLLNNLKIRVELRNYNYDKDNLSSKEQYLINIQNFILSYCTPSDSLKDQQNITFCLPLINHLDDSDIKNKEQEIKEETKEAIHQYKQDEQHSYKISPNSLEEDRLDICLLTLTTFTNFIRCKKQRSENSIYYLIEELSKLQETVKNLYKKEKIKWVDNYLQLLINLAFLYNTSKQVKKIEGLEKDIVKIKNELYGFKDIKVNRSDYEFRFKGVHSQNYNSDIVVGYRFYSKKQPSISELWKEKYFKTVKNLALFYKDSNQVKKSLDTEKYAQELAIEANVLSDDYINMLKKWAYSYSDSKYYDEELMVRNELTNQFHGLRELEPTGYRHYINDEYLQNIYYLITLYINKDQLDKAILLGEDTVKEIDELYASIWDR